MRQLQDSGTSPSSAENGGSGVGTGQVGDKSLVLRAPEE